MNPLNPGSFVRPALLAVTVFILASGACQHKRRGGPSSAQVEVALLTTNPADGESGVRPDVQVVTLQFDSTVTPENIKVELRPGDYLDERVRSSVTPLPLAVRQGTAESEVEVLLPALLDTNREYALLVEDADADVSPRLSSAFLEFYTGILPLKEPTEAVVGQIMDAKALPLSRVKVRDMGTGEIVLAGFDGQFRLRHVPLGARRIEFNAAPRPEHSALATLIFPLFVLPGFEGAFTKPVYLPEIDLEHAVPVNPAGVTVVTSPLVPGFKLTVQPGAARMMDMSIPKDLSITEVSTQNPPMGPPPGRVFERLFTMQPAGVTFNPPAEVEYPAPVGLPLGTIVPLVHYDKGAMRWVAFGRAQVVVGPAGNIVRSLPGEGVVKTAWQAPAPSTEYTAVVAEVDSVCSENGSPGLLAARLASLARLAIDQADSIDQTSEIEWAVASGSMLLALSDATAVLLSIAAGASLGVVAAPTIVAMALLGGGLAGLISLSKSEERRKKAKTAQLVKAIGLLRQAEDIARTGFDCSGRGELLEAARKLESGRASLEKERFEVGNFLASVSEWIVGLNDKANRVLTLKSYLDAFDAFSIQGGQSSSVSGQAIVNQAQGIVHECEELYETMSADYASHDLSDDIAVARGAIDAAIGRLRASGNATMPSQSAVPGGITSFGSLVVTGQAIGSKIVVDGRVGYVGASGDVRIEAVPAGVSVGGGLVSVRTLTPEFVSGAFGGQGDEDGDGMPDDWEMATGLDPAMDDADADPDNDGLTNLEEYLYYGSPNDADTDNNGVPDGDEVRRGRDASEQGGDPDAPALVSIDPPIGAANATFLLRGDGFGSNDAAVHVVIGAITIDDSLVTLVADNQISVHLPSPFVPGDLIVLRDTPSGTRASNPIYLDVDSDGDGLGDRLETTIGTNPNLGDTDGDGLVDGVEQTLGTNPLSNDSDGDGLRDGFEVQTSGTDPLATDSDGNGVPDGQEDPDGDGIVNLWEQSLGSDPNTPNRPLTDTDGDGLPDQVELAHGGNPLVVDTDDDGATDLQEYNAGLRLDDNDTDGDGLSDGTELFDIGDPLVSEDWSVLTVGAGQVVTVRGRNALGALIVASGGRLTTAEADGSLAHRIEVHADSVLVEVGGLIDARGKGFLGGGIVDAVRGRSFGNAVTGAGQHFFDAGSHGGGGSLNAPLNGGRTLGWTYGRPDAPAMPGAGGNQGCNRLGGDGGGVVKIVGDTLIIHGDIDARGADVQPGLVTDPFNPASWCNPGPGAGGSIWIEANLLQGNGRLLADGGGAPDCGSGHGAPTGRGAGGGRIAVRVSQVATVEPLLSCGGGVGALGGGAPGTIWRVDPSRPNGNLSLGTPPLPMTCPGAVGDTQPRTAIPGLNEVLVAGVGNRVVLNLVGQPPLLAGQLAGLDLVTEAGDFIGRIRGNGTDRVELEPGSAPVIVGQRVATGMSVGRVAGSALSRASWQGRLALVGGSATDAEFVGDWAGGSLDLGPSIGQLSVRDGGLQVTRLTQAGSPNVQLSALSADSALLASPISGGEWSIAVVTGRAAEFRVAQAVTCMTFDLVDGSAWYGTRASDGKHVPIDVRASVSMRIDGPHDGYAASRIDATGLGYRGGSLTPSFWQFGETYPGVREGLNGAAPGTHGAGGGFGGLGAGPSQGRVYGQITVVDLPGSGGGFNNFANQSWMVGGSGGGLIRLEAPELTIDGIVNADGGRGIDWCWNQLGFPVGAGSSGSGSGGGVQIVAGTLLGSGRVSANGGIQQRAAATVCSCWDAPVGPGKAGGGGRIAVSAGQNLFGGTMEARGGWGSEILNGACALGDSLWSGGAGTVFVRTGAQTYGTLTIDNGGVVPAVGSTPLAALALGSGQAHVESPGNRIRTANVIYGDPAGYTYGHVGRFVIVDGQEANPYRIVAHGADWMDLDRNVDAPIGGAVTFVGAHYFDGVVVRGRAQVALQGDALVVPRGVPQVEAGAAIQ